MAIIGASARVGIVAVLACSFACCCGTSPLGTPCIDPSVGAGPGVRVVSPALECRSRLCLVTKRAAGATTASCTDECSSDHDCAAMANLYCAGGYACTTVAGFPRPVCACRESLDGGDWRDR